MRSRLYLLVVLEVIFVALFIASCWFSFVSSLSPQAVKVDTADLEVSSTGEFFSSLPFD